MLKIHYGFPSFCFIHFCISNVNLLLFDILNYRNNDKKVTMYFFNINYDVSTSDNLKLKLYLCTEKKNSNA
jgi:hypothetical protein